MSTDYEFDVFLAHHSGDKPLVRQISNKLKQRGLKPWIDEEQIAPGRSFQDEIQQAIPIVKTAAIILGKDGLGRWQQWEIKTFFTQCVNRGTIIIPILLPGVSEVPESLLFLRELRWVNFNNPEDATALTLLLWGITGERPQEALKDRFPSTIDTEIVIETIQSSSFDADTYFNQALARLDIRDYEGAIEGFTRSIQLDPGYVDAYINRGVAHSNSDEKQKALEDYNEAIRLKPNYAIAYNNRGLVRFDLGDKHGAIEDYNKAIELNPNYADAYINRGVAHDDLGNNQGAIEDYNKAIELKSDDADAYNNRGAARSALGDNQGAIEDYNKAIELDPNCADAYINRGYIHATLGDKQRASEDYQQAANSYKKQGNKSDYQDALKQLRQLR